MYRNFAGPLKDERLFEWHRLVVRGRWDLKAVGQYRQHEEPMRIVSGAIHDPVIHFEAPPSQQVTLVALSIILEKHRSAYDEELGVASRAIEISRWLEFFGAMVLEAQEQSLRRIGFLVEKSKFSERYRGQLNERQEKVLLRVFREGVDGFEGGLSSKNHISITGCSPATATRDLAKLVELGALVRTGELKNARYFLKLE